MDPLTFILIVLHSLDQSQQHPSWVVSTSSLGGTHVCLQKYQSNFWGINSLLLFTGRFFFLFSTFLNNPHISPEEFQNIWSILANTKQYTMRTWGRFQSCFHSLFHLTQHGSASIKSILWGEIGGKSAGACIVVVCALVAVRLWPFNEWLASLHVLYNVPGCVLDMYLCLQCLSLPIGCS